MDRFSPYLYIGNQAGLFDAAGSPADSLRIGLGAQIRGPATVFAFARFVFLHQDANLPQPSGSKASAWLSIPAYAKAEKPSASITALVWTGCGSASYKPFLRVHT